MQYERVHEIWDLYDGVRTGVADFNGATHYFASLYDESAEHEDNFRLFPVGSEFMRKAARSWEIFRAWERKFHYGEADLKTHPGHGGIIPEYDELKAWLEGQLPQLQALPALYRAKFRELPNQDSLPGGILRELEVAWSEAPEAPL